MEKEIEVYCSIHLGNCKISETLTLNCNHRFCSDCLIADWTNNINNGFVDSSRLKCPHDGCNVPISYSELKGNLPANIFKKYEEFSFNNFSIKESDKKEKIVICPDPKCQIKSFIWAEASFFTCWKCKEKFCAECSGNWKNHEGLTCEEFKTNKENGITKEDLAMNKIIENEKWMKCPKCKIIVEKIEFCNFIRCRSNVCQKKTCFCYLCGDILTEETHYTHFKDNNPYNDRCINFERLEDDKKKQNIKKKPENKQLSQKCPGCKTQDPNLCENLWDSFIKCSNKNCKFKGNIICLRCLEMTRENQDDFLISHPQICEGKQNKCGKNCILF